jgi:hypothetical protein
MLTVQWVKPGYVLQGPPVLRFRRRVTVAYATTPTSPTSAASASPASRGASAPSYTPTITDIKSARTTDIKSAHHCQHLRAQQAELLAVELSPRLVMWSSTELPGWPNLCATRVAAAFGRCRDMVCGTAVFTGGIPGNPASLSVTLAVRVRDLT